MMARNGDLIRSGQAGPFQIPSEYGLFRVISHGELSSVSEVHWIYQLALMNPSVQFGFWTKRKSIVWAADELMDRPKNVVMVYSEAMVGKVLESPPPGFDKAFCVIGPKQKGHHVNCGDKLCRDCQLCYHKKGAKIIIERAKLLTKEEQKTLGIL
jgi:hypothetical protein